VSEHRGHEQCEGVLGVLGVGRGGHVLAAHEGRGREHAQRWQQQLHLPLAVRDHLDGGVGGGLFGAARLGRRRRVSGPRGAVCDDGRREPIERVDAEALLRDRAQAQDLEHDVVVLHGSGSG